MSPNAVHAIPPTSALTAPSATQAHAAPQPQSEKAPSALPQDKVTLSAAAQSVAAGAKAEPSASPKSNPLINAQA